MRRVTTSQVPPTTPPTDPRGLPPTGDTFTLHANNPPGVHFNPNNTSWTTGEYAIVSMLYAGAGSRLAYPKKMRLVIATPAVMTGPLWIDNEFRAVFGTPTVGNTFQTQIVRQSPQGIRSTPENGTYVFTT